MAGSRKGERRGGAKPGRVRKSGLKNPNALDQKVRGFNTGAGRQKGSKPRSKFDPALGVILNKQNSPMVKERELEMYFMAVGKRMRLPKEVMLDAMRYLEESAIEWGEVVRANMRKLVDAKTVEEQQLFDGACAAAETRMREYILMAVDVAYKAAPYVHPRLAAMITNPGASDLPINAIATLFRDLDEAGRAPRYIDHDPNEVAKQ